MTARPSQLRLTTLLGWLPVLIPVVLGVVGLITGEVPELFYLFSDPIAMPALAGAAILLMLVFPAMFAGISTQVPSAGELPPRARLGLRVAGAVAVILGCLVLRVVVIRAATPTRLAVDRMRAHAAAVQAIGTPVTLGWDVRGWIHADAEVNDELVPPTIDASVPVQGPRGSGVLAIDGHLVNDRWVFDRVVLRLDRGGKIEIVSGVVPPRPEAFDPSVLGTIGGAFALVALLVPLLMVGLRGSDPKRAVASVLVRPGVPFTLRFTPAEARRFRVWLRFELEWQGGEDDYGISAHIDVRGGDGPPVQRKLLVGDEAPALGPGAVQNTTSYRVTSMSSSEGATRRATVELAEVSGAVGTEVVVTGSVVIAERCTPGELLVFVVPR
ncbi:Hypothetical protein A7982_05114 [Minicystis rosea]|nr:Hypothetical protein A7982_05114 [Minicystis rosea]